MDGATTVLFQYGLAGVVIFALAIAVVNLYRDNQRLQKEKESILEARRQDAVDTTDNVTKPLSDIAQTQRLIYDKLVASKGA